MSVKVALFSHNDAYELVETVNDFCKDKKVVDIKFCDDRNAMLNEMEKHNGEAYERRKQ